MRTVLILAGDLLREAMSRKWFLALFLGISTFLIALTFTLRIHVIDGALFGMTFLGNPVTESVEPLGHALRSTHRLIAYGIFYGGLGFGVLACSDFAPGVLSPGRIEYLLSLPIARWQLLAGHFLGVMILSTACTLYGSGGVSLILAWKTGVWDPGLVLAGLLANVAFVGVYGPMLLTAFLSRSAALSSLAGILTYLSGVIASYREEVAAFLQQGVARALFQVIVLPLPRVSRLADAAAELAASGRVDVASLLLLISGTIAFGLANLAITIWRFEKKNF